MFQDISIEELIELKDKNELTLIDVRSPSEYREATIPGSINIPLFNDEERAEVGTIYKQVSVEAAKQRGLEIASAKLPRFVKEFAEIKGKKVVFCWRGGMRSRTTATVLSLMDIHVSRLAGGYRTYRTWVVEQLETLQLKPKAYVLNGYTGTGKTIILHSLNEEGYPILDLEGMANHRGSVFGQIGLEPSNQKKFDALLYEKIKQVQQSPFVLIEGESKRIGRVVIPDFVLEKKNQGLQLFVELPIEERVKHILEDYQPWTHEQECLEAFTRVKRRIHTPIANKIEMDLKSGDYASAVKLLLEYYYDPLYDHTAEQFPEDQKITIKVKTTDEAIDYIRKLISTQDKLLIK